MAQQSFAAQLLSEFQRYWQILKDSSAEGVEPNQKEAVQQLLPLIASQPEALPHAIGELANGYDSGSRELVTLLRPLREQFDPTGAEHLRLVNNQRLPASTRREAAAYLAQFPTPEVQAKLRKVLLTSNDYWAWQAALDALIQQRDSELLPLLKTLKGKVKAFGMDSTEILLPARGQMGDVKVARPLMELRNSPSYSRSWAGQEGISGLEKWVGGAEALAAQLVGPQSGQKQSALRQLAWHDSSTAVRCWALERLGQLGLDQNADVCLHALTSQEWTEQKAACYALAALAHPPVEALKAQVAQRYYSIQQRGWAALTLKELGYSVDPSQLRELQVPLPPQITPELYTALARWWARGVTQKCEMGKA